MKNYTDHFNSGRKELKEKIANTPQMERTPGRTDEVKNNAGGYVFSVGSVGQLRRFLILGSEGGSFYVSERKLTKENASNVVKCIQENGPATVAEIVRVSQEGRAPKNDPAIFALALAATYGDEATKKLAYENIRNVCRTGTHLFQFNELVQNLRGWSRGLRGGVGKFYTKRSDDQLALQLIKYRQREGWTHRDVLRLAHVKPASESQAQLLRWAVGKEAKVENRIVNAFEEVQKLGTTDIKRTIQLVQEVNLPWEALPTEILGDKRVWEALLPGMPLMALVRNLGKMSSIGVLKSNLDDSVKTVVSKLSSAEEIKKARLHPLFILNALKTYQSGHGFKGSLSWTAVPTIVDVLDEAFYMGFDAVEPAGKNFMLGLDISGSMSGPNIANMNISPREGTAVMAMVTVRTEPFCAVGAFTTNFRVLDIGKKDSLATVLKKISGLPMGGTDCNQPILWATKEKLNVDTFVTYTDNETWANQHNKPFQVLNQYRQKMNKPNAQNIVVAMSVNDFTIADPKDPRQLDIVGFDTGTPQVISAFAAGLLD